MFSRNTNFNQKRNQTTVFGSTLNGYPYDEQLGGPGGCHIHVWLPGGLSKEARQRELEACWEEAVRQGDVLSMSWDWQEEKIECQHWVEADLEKLRGAQGFIEVRWPDHSKIGLDNFSKSALLSVYDRLNEENQKAFRDLLAKGPAGLTLLVDRCFEIFARQAAGKIGVTKGSE